VACSPASVYRVLKTANLLGGASPVPTKKGTGFVQPLLRVLRPSDWTQNGAWRVGVD
jgi:hypothetical protein